MDASISDLYFFDSCSQAFSGKVDYSDWRIVDTGRVGARGKSNPDLMRQLSCQPMKLKRRQKADNCFGHTQSDFDQ